MCRSAVTRVIEASVDKKGIVTLRTGSASPIEINMSGKIPKGLRNVELLAVTKDRIKIYTYDGYDVTFVFDSWPDVMHTLADQAIAKVEALHERATTVAPRVMPEMADKIMGRIKAPKPVIKEKVVEKDAPEEVRITPRIKVMR